jgi:hypothetical protein
MKQEHIEAAIETAGLTPPSNTSFEVSGEDPFFRSPMNLATGASAALVMLGSAVDDIWHLRHDKRQHISIDSRHAALSLLSAWLLTIDGESAFLKLADRDGHNQVSGAFECEDGQRIHLQPGFAHHSDATLSVLNCEPSPTAVATAIRKWRSGSLETALSEAGVPAVIIRDWPTWQQHPQGIAMTDIPVVEIEKIGDAPAVMPAPSRLPLSNIRVLDLTRVLAGPTCSRILGEFGADVLHVDSPHLPDLKPGQADTAHGKRMTFLDLEQQQDSDVLGSLSDTTDVFVQSYRAGSLARRGFGPNELAQHRPGIVYVSVNCYGHHGPWINRPGYDGNAMAATGINLIQNAPPEPGIAIAMNDYCTAYWGAYGALRALHKRATEGGSWHVKVSLTQSAMWFLRMGVPHDRTRGLPANEITSLASDYMSAEDTAYGRLMQLTPALNLSETPPAWRRKTPLPGSSEAIWADYQ